MVSAQANVSDRQAPRRARGSRPATNPGQGPVRSTTGLPQVAMPLALTAGGPRRLRGELKGPHKVSEGRLPLAPSRVHDPHSYGDAASLSPRSTNGSPRLEWWKGRSEEFSPAIGSNRRLGGAPIFASLHQRLRNVKLKSLTPDR